MENAMYEMTYVLTPILEEDKLEEADAGIQALIEKHGGLIESHDTLQKKRLAFAIMNAEEGNYGCVKFTMPGESIAKLQEDVLKQNPVLRHMIVKWQDRQSRYHAPARPTYTPKVEQTSKTDEATIDHQLDQILVNENELDSAK